MQIPLEEQVQTLPLLSRSRALQAIRARNREDLGSTGVAFYVSGIFDYLFNENDPVLDLGKRFTPLLPNTQILGDSHSAGDLVILSTGQTPVHFGVVLGNGTIFSLEHLNRNTYTVKPLAVLREEYHGRRLDFYRRAARSHFSV